MIPNFLVDVFERLGHVNQSIYQQDKFTGQNYPLADRPSEADLLIAQSNGMVTGYVNNKHTVSQARSSSESGHQAYNNAYASYVSDALSSTTTTAGVYVSYDDDAEVVGQSPSIPIATPAQPLSTSHGSIFSSFYSLDPYQSGAAFSVSVYDDDWDPITRSHNVQHDQAAAGLGHLSTSAVARNKEMSDASTKYWESDATYIIIVIIFPILLAVGTLGNALTYIVLHRKTFTDKTAASWLFKCLAGMCTICLWVGLPRHWLRAVFGFDVRQLHFLVCQLHRFTLYCAMDITTWIIVSISADRLVAVLLPFRAHFISTQKNAKRAFIGLCLFFAVFNGHIFFTYGRRYAVKNVSNSTLTASHLFMSTTPKPSLLSIYMTQPDVVVDVNQAFHYSTKSNSKTSAEIMTRKRRAKKSTSIAAATSAKPAPVTVVVSECQERDIAEILFYNRIIHPWMSFAMYVIGPFCFMLASSITIARKLAQRRAFLKKSQTIGKPTSALATLIAATRERQQTTVQLRRGTTSVVVKSNPYTEALKRAAANSAQRSTTVLLFAASIEFLITATPAFFLDIAEKPLKQSGAFSTPQGMARFQLLYTIVRLLLFSNFALHFFLFCLSAHRFRREVVKVFCCCLGMQSTAAMVRDLKRQQAGGAKVAAINNKNQQPAPSSSSSDIVPEASSKVATAVHRMVAHFKNKTSIVRQSTSSMDDDDDRPSSKLANYYSRRQSTRLLVGMRLIDENTTTSGCEMLHPTTPLTSSTLSAVKRTSSLMLDENDFSIHPPAADKSEGRNSASIASREYLVITPQTAAALTSAACQTFSVKNAAFLEANSCADFLLMSGNSNVGEDFDEDHDDGCFEDFNSGGAASSSAKHNSSNHVINSDAAEVASSGGVGGSNEAIILSPAAKASADLANLPPPPELYVTLSDALLCASMNSSGGPSPDITAALNSMMQAKDKQSRESQLLDDCFDEGDLTLIGAKNDFPYFGQEAYIVSDSDDSADFARSSSMASYMNTYSELDDDEMRMELLRGYTSLKSVAKQFKNPYFENLGYSVDVDKTEPLLVTVINNSYSSINDAGNQAQHTPCSATPTDTVNGRPSLRLMYPPLAKLDSDFFRAQSRSSISSSSHQQQMPIYRLNNGSFNSMRSCVVENRRCNSTHSRRTVSGHRSGSHGEYYYYPRNSNDRSSTTGNTPPNPLYRRHSRNSRPSSIVYVYLTEPMEV